MSSIYFTSLAKAAAGSAAASFSCHPEKKRGLPMGNGSSPLRYAVPAPEGLTVRG